jgi:hypothetical protein
MRLVFGAVLLFALIAPALAEPNILVKNRLRLADATSDACFAGCASQNDSCKRACPTTISIPCLGVCDSQAQTCRESCRRK